MADDAVNTGASVGTGALSGAAAGSVVPGLGTAAGAIIGGIGGLVSASARGGAANAQAAAAGYDREQALQAAAPTWGELAAHRQQINLGRTATARVDKLLGSMDKVFLESSRQALAMLQGQKAALLNPALDERARGRASLIANLHSRLGSGALDGDSGNRALSDYDRETGLLTAQIQSKALDQVFGFLTNNKPSIGEAGQINQDVSGTFNNFANRKLAAITGNRTAPYAGAGFTEAAINGNNLINIGKGIGEFASGGGFKQLTGGAKAPAAGANNGFALAAANAVPAQDDFTSFLKRDLDE